MKYFLIAVVFSAGLFGAAATVDAKSIIYLIRHAEKQDDGTRDPSLTEQGRVRAEWLTEWFEGRDLSAIYSSEFKRTLETVAPLSERLNLPITPYNPRTLQDLADRLGEAEGVILVSGHSNTTPMLVNLLIGEERYPELEEAWEYDYIFMVTLGEEGESSVEISHSEPRSVVPGSVVPGSVAPGETAAEATEE